MSACLQQALQAPPASYTPPCGGMPTTQAKDDVSDPGLDVTYRKLLTSLLDADLWSVRWVQGPCYRTATVCAGPPEGARSRRRWMAAAVLSCGRTPRSGSA